MAEIDLTPTEEMAANAARGLELRRKHGKGGTEIGVARARDISNRKNLSPETVRRMHAFFSRHEKNKAGGEDDAGYIAWMLWSGDAGRDWAKRKVEQMNKGENQRSDTYKEIAQRLGSAAKMGVQYVAPRSPVSKPERKYRVRLESRDTGKTIDFRTMATSDADARYQADAAYGKKWQILAVIEEHSRPGTKAKFAQPPFSASDLNALKRLVKQYEKLGKESAGELDRAHHHKALAIASTLHEIIDFAASGKTGRAYAQVRISTPEFQKLLPASLVKAAYDVTKSDTYFRPGAKAKFAVSITGRRGRQPGIPGGWLTGTWDGGKWAALVFAEASAAEYGLPEFRNISKLWIADKKGKDIVNYDRGWDVKPATPEARQAFMEIGRVASAEASKMPASRPGAKAKMGKRYDAKIVGNELVRSDGRRYRITGRKPSLPNAREMLGEVEWLMMVGENGSEYSVQRFDDGGYRVFGGGSGMRVQWDGLVRASRPGAKARMSKEWQTIERYLEVLDTEFGEPRGKAAAQEMMRAAAAIGGDEGARLKAAINTMATSRDYNARQRAYNAIASMMPFSRPGAKAKMAQWEATQTKKHGKPIVEHTAKINGVSYMIEKPDAMGTMATLYMWNDNRGMERIATGDVAALKARAEGMRKKEARGVAAIERLANYSRPGAKAKMAESLQAMWDGKQWKVTTPSGAAWYSEDGKRWTKKHGEPVTPAEVRQYAIKLGTGFSRPGAKVANAIREGEKVSASDDAVSRKIRKLMDEGKPQKQAVAIALDLERRGEL